MPCTISSSPAHSTSRTRGGHPPSGAASNSINNSAMVASRSRARPRSWAAATRSGWSAAATEGLCLLITPKRYVNQALELLQAHISGPKTKPLPPVATARTLSPAIRPNTCLEDSSRTGVHTLVGPRTC
jgi:hypothetical protein